jgi:hypothetical protein
MYSCPECGEEMTETATGDCWCDVCEEGYTRDEMILMYGLLDEEEEDYEQDESKWHKDAVRVRDAIDRAFTRLNKQGVTARANFACCQGCACAEIEDEAKRKDTGYCFYHAQDAENLRDSARTYLAFGSLAEKASAATVVKIGKTIVAELSKEPALEIEWNGSRDTRILVSASGG